MKVVFDKDLATEFEVVGSDYYENISEDGASMTIVYRCRPDNGEVAPDYSEIYGREFTTANAETDRGSPITIAGGYHNVWSVNVSYSESQQVYSVNVTIK